MCSGHFHLHVSLFDVSFLCCIAVSLIVFTGECSCCDNLVTHTHLLPPSPTGTGTEVKGQLGL